MTDPEFSVGDQAVFCDAWWHWKREQAPPLEERTVYTVNIIGDDGKKVMVSWNDYAKNGGKKIHQLLATDWLQKVPKEADAESASPQ